MEKNKMDFFLSIYNFFGIIWHIFQICIWNTTTQKTIKIYIYTPFNFRLPQILALIFVPLIFVPLTAFFQPFYFRPSKIENFDPFYFCPLLQRKVRTLKQQQRWNSATLKAKRGWFKKLNWIYSLKSPFLGLICPFLSSLPFIFALFKNVLIRSL